MSPEEFEALRQELREQLYRQAIAVAFGLPSPGSLEARYWLRRPRSSKRRQAVEKARQRLREPRGGALWQIAAIEGDRLADLRREMDDWVWRLRLLADVHPIDPRLLIAPVSA